MIISKLKVLRSAAGYYVGRTYKCNDGDEGPYSRESRYMPKKDAEKTLLTLEKEDDV